MTGKLDKRMRAVGQRLVDDYGKPVTLRRTTSTFDPDTGKTTETTTDHSVNAVLENYEASRVDGSVVQSGDLQATLPARDLSVTPDPETDTLIVNSETWSIVNAGRVYSGEQVAIHQLQVRQ